LVFDDDVVVIVVVAVGNEVNENVIDPETQSTSHFWLATAKH
jgi:hypothetical protein